MNPRSLSRILDLPAWVWVALAALYATWTSIAVQVSSNLDLFPLWAAGRLLDHGQADHVYTGFRSPMIVTDPVWLALAKPYGIAEPPPYVQPPYLAYLTEPLSRALDFPAFAALFQAVNMAAVFVAVLIAIRMWAPSLWRAGPVLGLPVVIVLSQPAVLGMLYNQTQALILACTIGGFAASRRNRPVAAGLLIGIAAAIKLMPALILGYWLLTGRWRQAAVGTACLALAAAASLALIPAVMLHGFLDNLRVMSEVAILGAQNYALMRIMIWWQTGISLRYSLDPIPADIATITRVLLALVIAACAAVRNLSTNPRERDGADVVFLVGTLPLLSVAWNHYFTTVLVAGTYLLGTRKPAAALAYGIASVLISLNLYVFQWYADIAVPMMADTAVLIIVVAVVFTALSARVSKSSVTGEAPIHA